MQTFETKDSGQREDFATGSRRDTQDGKPRYELVSPIALRREAELMARGAAKYGDRNWELGQPFARTYGSLLRHCYAWAAGDRTEDHLAAIRFNAGALAHFEDEIQAGRLPGELNDMAIPLTADATGKAWGEAFEAAARRTLGTGAKVRLLAGADNIEEDIGHLIGRVGAVVGIAYGHCHDGSDGYYVEIDKDDFYADGGFYWHADALEVID